MRSSAAFQNSAFKLLMEDISVTTSIFQTSDYVENTSDRSENDATLADKLFTDSRQTTLPIRSPQNDAADDAAVIQGFPRMTVASDGAAISNQSTMPSASDGAGSVN